MPNIKADFSKCNEISNNLNNGTSYWTNITVILNIAVIKKSVEIRVKLSPTYSSILLLIGLFFLNCDSTTAPTSLTQNVPTLTSISTTPDQVIFSQEINGYSDTTLSIKLRTEIDFADPETPPYFVVTEIESRNILYSGVLQNIDENIFDATFEFETSTTSFTTLLIEVFAYNADGKGNFAQTRLPIQGFSNNIPEVLEVDNPDVVVRPGEGEASINTFFYAKVTDKDGQQTIDRVLVRLIDLETGEVSGSPFQMFDNGSSFNDAVAADSVYTVGFEISFTTNRPDRDYRLEYYAIDQGGLHSDTLQTSFKLRSN